MSRENVEIVRAIWPATVDMVEFVGAGAPFPPEQAARFRPDAEVEFVTGSPGTPPLRYRGLGGFTEGWSEWLSPFDRYQLEPRDFIDAGDDVVVLVHVCARTHRDGVVVRHDPAAVLSVHEGHVVRVRFFLERAAALAAAGLAG